MRSMPMLTTLAAAVATISTFSSNAAEPATANATPIALHCPRLIDTEAGKLLGESTIVIDGKRIREVRSGHVSVDGAQDIELKDVTCMPGLIDSHTHLTDRPVPPRTTISSAGTRPTTRSAARSMRDARSRPVSPRCAMSATTTTTRCRCAMRSMPASFQARASSPPAPRSAQPAATPIDTNGYRHDLAGDPGREGRHHQFARRCVESGAPALQEWRGPDQDHAFRRRARRKLQRGQRATDDCGNPGRGRRRARLWLHRGRTRARRRRQSAAR